MRFMNQSKPVRRWRFSPTNVAILYLCEPLRPLRLCGESILAHIHRRDAEDAEDAEVAEIVLISTLPDKTPPFQVSLLLLGRCYVPRGVIA